MFSSFSVKLKGETYADPRLALKGREFALVGRLFDSSLWSKISWIPGVKNTDPLLEPLNEPLLEPLRLSLSSLLLAMISPTASMTTEALIEQHMIMLINWRNFQEARTFENGDLLWIPSRHTRSWSWTNEWSFPWSRILIDQFVFFDFFTVSNWSSPVNDKHDILIGKEGSEKYCDDFATTVSFITLKSTDQLTKRVVFLFQSRVNSLAVHFQ